MKDKYVSPKIELIVIEPRDVLTVSDEGGVTLPDDEFV